MTTNSQPRDWLAWHDDYDRAGTPLAVRLAVVQSHVRQALDAAPPGTIRVVSICAGQGRDLVEVVATHERRDDVSAVLVEADERNVLSATRRISELGLDRGIRPILGDASVTDRYVGHTPAHLVLACGIFGNIGEDDIHNTIRHLPSFCSTGATVLWTRHRRPPDLTPTVRRWFGDAGFEEIAFAGLTHLPYIGVGAVRWPGANGALPTGTRLFNSLG